MKKRILFAAYTLDVGGIETALVNLLNELIKEYDITLVLEKKQGVFVNDINKKIKIIEYNPNQNKNVFIRKTINLIKRIKFIIKYKNRFDFSASFTTYSKMSSFCARTASRNNALWIHSDYIEFYNKDIKKVKDFFEFISYDKFKKIILVSEQSKNNFIIHFKNMQEKTILINNIINYKELINKSKEKINFDKKNKTIFLNVSRHDEKSKKISLLINAAEKLKQDKENFQVVLIGNGEDTKMYKEMVFNKELQNEVIFLGEKKNPYPYFLISDALILTSEYEGYPVVFHEARILNLPIITTNVSDSQKDIKNKYGIVVKKNEDSIYDAMKQFIHERFIIKKQFDAEKYNNYNLNKIKNIIENK